MMYGLQRPSATDPIAVLTGEPMKPQALEHALASLPVEDFGLSFADTGASLAQGGDGDLVLTTGFPCDTVADSYRQAVADAVPGAASVAIQTKIEPRRCQKGMPALDQVSNIIAVSSGKGGVGKSTTAVNLALALQAEGARVGLLDADVFGPSQPIMLGMPADTRPEVLEGQWFVPVTAHGLQTMSMGYLVGEDAPVVWRGPKASGALQQMITQTRWQGLDYLIVDLPPGTGDIQLTLAQRVPVAGSVVVTTPQDIALADAIKGIEMFRKVDVAVLGIVENMAVHVCSNCGHAEHIFGEGGGERVSARYQVPLLGSLPLSRSIREQADGGLPTVLAAPDSAEAASYRRLARHMAARLAMSPKATRAFPAVTSA